MQAAVGITGMVPVVETERLRMRGHRLEDFEHSLAMWSDPVVVRYTTGKPQTSEDVWMRMLRYAGLWAFLGYGYWAVEEKDTGAFVGEMGFADFRREIEPSLDGMPEIGWVLASPVHGKGYATELVKAAVAWGDMQFGASKTCCIINPENTASVRVAEKCGYGELTQGAYKDHSVIIFTRDPRRP
jgi:RimJ/RimL family protein N-acetyltransferase